MSRRQKPRIDYKKLNSTGAVVHKDLSRGESEVSELSLLFGNCSIHENKMADDQRLEIEIDVLCSDIVDIIDENPIAESSSQEEVDNVVVRLEELRSTFKLKNNELKRSKPDNYANDYDESYQKTLSIIKDYIKSSKEFKTKLSVAEMKIKVEEVIHKEISIMFLSEDTIRRISELEDDLVRWKGELVEANKKYEKVAEKNQELLKFSTASNDIKTTVQHVGERYVNLTSSKNEFTSLLKKALEEKELDKQSLIKESQLNIKLLKFSGYESAMDIYTFQSNFEKLHVRTTPKRLLPDLLINNFLLEPVLSLVKGLEDIDEIWRRLKQSYGDTKIMLTKKLSQINKTESLSKAKDPEKLTFMLSKLINCIKDLMKIASDHKIENRLYYGDGLEKIYKLMGDGRMTRCLATISDQTLSERKQ